jgi:hypothetical protein
MTGARSNLAPVIILKRWGRRGATSVHQPQSNAIRRISVYAMPGREASRLYTAHSMHRPSTNYSLFTINYSLSKCNYLTDVFQTVACMFFRKQAWTNVLKGRNFHKGLSQKGRPFSYYSCSDSEVFGTKKFSSRIFS